MWDGSKMQEKKFARGDTFGGRVIFAGKVIFEKEYKHKNKLILIKKRSKNLRPRLGITVIVKKL